MKFTALSLCFFAALSPTSSLHLHTLDTHGSFIDRQIKIEDIIDCQFMDNCSFVKGQIGKQSQSQIQQACCNFGDQQRIWSCCDAAKKIKGSQNPDKALTKLKSQIFKNFPTVIQTNFGKMQTLRRKIAVKKDQIAQIQAFKNNQNREANRDLARIKQIQALFNGNNYPIDSLQLSVEKIHAQNRLSNFQQDLKNLDSFKANLSELENELKKLQEQDAANTNTAASTEEANTTEVAKEASPNQK